MINKKNAHNLYKCMLRIRRVQEAIADRYREQEMRCPLHLCIGQEAIAAGVIAAMSDDDMIFSNHRSHGHYLAKGGSLTQLIAELYGRSAGCCGGRGGSMHLIDLSVGFMGSTPIVGGTVPLAVGAAWAASLQSTNQVVSVFFGDGCFEEGVLHESMNFAALHKLPVLFICENNDFSVYTRRSERQPDRPICSIAEAHGLSVETGDGHDVEEVLSKSIVACNRARNGDGPQFLEFSVYRWREHCGPNFDDDLGYRSQEEIRSGLSGCPIASYGTRLINLGTVDEAMIDQWEGEIHQEILSSFESALASGIPSIDDAATMIYG